MSDTGRRSGGPAAMLFRNGNAAFFDADGRQIPELQALGWCGLRGFAARFPAAPVTLSGGDVLDPAQVPWLLRHLRESPEGMP